MSTTAADRPPGRARRRRTFRRALRYALLSIGAIVILFPLYVTVVNSLLPADQLARRPPPLVPIPPQWHTYATAWSSGHVGQYLATSALVTAAITLGQLLTAVLAGYAFAFLRFPLRQVLFVAFLATLMIPFEVTLITNLSTVTSLGWFNSYAGLAVPFLATGFGTFLLRQAFLQIPPDLREAAELEGAGNLWFLWRVALPLVRPALAALAVFAFLGAWNQYLWPLVATGGTHPLFTVQIGLKQLQGTQVNQINVTLAGTVIAVAPLLVLLVAFQKQLVRGLTAGAVR